uniref:Uncharacterized protein n=1 Tax=Arundo donax TaxID=35708 RepID=A0A0A9CJK1_ARUDO
MSLKKSHTEMETQNCLCSTLGLIQYNLKILIILISFLPF